LDDRWRLSQILATQALGALTVGDPKAGRAAAEEGRELAEAIGDRLDSRRCRWCLGLAQAIEGELAGAAAQFAEVVAEAEVAHDAVYKAQGLSFQGMVLAHQGDTGAARATAEAAIEAAAELGAIATGNAYVALAWAALAAGDIGTALRAADQAWRRHSGLPTTAALGRVVNAQAALAGGDLLAARRWADDAVASATGYVLMQALSARAGVAIAQGEQEQAERDAHDALPLAAEIKAYLFIPDTVECLASLAGQAGSHREAARRFGAADSIRQRTGVVRFKVWDAG
jgi:tetratricopeptide (TPR) repeat protein